MKEKEEYIYAGIPTFMGGELIREAEIKNYDIVFLGVPCDYGASYRLGAKYAPRLLREYSFWDRINGQKLYDIDNKFYLETNNFNIGDLGDVYVNPTNPAKNQVAISEKTFSIASESFPVICGGDHSITYGSFIGVYNAVTKKYPDYEIGIIHFDAHLDVEDDYLNMPEVWHGNVFRKLIQNQYLKGDNMFCIGQRGLVDKKWYNFVIKEGIHLFSSNDIKKQGIKNIINQIIKVNKNKKIKFYVTFDIDAIDSSYIFGTGTPQANGLTPYEADEALRSLKELDICAFDIVELNPTLDNSHSSFVVACELLYHFLALGLKKENKDE